MKKFIVSMSIAALTVSVFAAANPPADATAAKEPVVKAACCTKDASCKAGAEVKKAACSAEQTVKEAGCSGGVCPLPKK